MMGYNEPWPWPITSGSTAVPENERLLCEEGVLSSQSVTDNWGLPRAGAGGRSRRMASAPLP